MEAIQKDFSPKGVKFFFIYKALAHPEGGTKSYVAPFTVEERLAHIKQAYKELGNTIPWLCDNMNNDLKHAMGNRPNSEFIIDPEGKIVVLRDWSQPDTLRADLEKLVGKIPNPTQPSDLDLKIDRARPKYQKGVVKRPQITTQLMPVSVKPQESQSPFYVKLRVEVESSVIGSGQGKVYLGFHLDPIHSVHWNNLAAPLEYEVVGLSQGKLTPAKESFPKVEVESDIDPREFLLDASSLEKNGSFKVKVKYFACSDVEGWCKPVTQEYEVELKSDRDAGKARRSGSRSFAGGGRGFRGGEGGFRGGSEGFGRPNMSRPPGRGGFSVERLMSHDKNNDGKITFDEFPEKFNRIINRADLNGDKAIDKKEAEAMAERMNRRGGR